MAANLAIQPAGWIRDSTGSYRINTLGESAIVNTYNGPAGAIDTITIGPDFDGNSFRQTFTYSGSNLTNISQWVKQ